MHRPWGGAPLETCQDQITPLIKILYYGPFCAQRSGALQRSLDARTGPGLADGASPQIRVQRN